MGQGLLGQLGSQGIDELSLLFVHRATVLLLDLHTHKTLLILVNIISYFTIKYANIISQESSP